MQTVWIINHYAEPPGPGKFTRHFNFAKKLTERGYRVKIFTASTIHTTDINYIRDESPYKEMTVEGIDFVFIKTCDYSGNGISRVKNMTDYFFRTMSVTKKFGTCDIVYTSAPHSLTWLAAHRVAKRNHAAFVVETRDLWPKTFIAMGRMSENHPVAKILYGIEKYIYKRADALIFTFPGGKEYVESIGLNSDKVYYINNGIELEDFRKKASAEYEDEDLSDENMFNVVFTGALGAANGLYRVLDSMKLLQERGEDDIRLLLYGSGGEKEGLVQKCEEENIRNVIFKGRVQKKCIPPILKQSDLLLLSLSHMPELFRYGLSPNKLFEYLASGTPIISNVECGYDILEKYDAGITVKGDSVSALADGILYFKNLPTEKYEEYEKNAAKAAEDFDFDYLTDRLESVFEDVMKKEKI